MIVIGIDPGAKGGVATIYEDGSVQATVMPMIDNREINIVALQEWCEGAFLVVIERAQAMPGMKGMFTYGEQFGRIREMLRQVGIPCKQVRYKDWAEAVGLPKKKNEKHKPAIKYVMQKHPTVNIIAPGCRTPHSGMADAICIAEYGKEKL